MNKIADFFNGILSNTRLHFVFMSLVAIFLFVTNSKNECTLKQTITELDRSNKSIDSLRSVIFTNEIDLGRYEYILSLLETENPKLYEKIMNQTE
jgi:hypothetical protein